MKANQTLQQTADHLGVDVQTLLQVLFMLRTMIDQADATKTQQAIVKLPRIIE